MLAPVFISDHSDKELVSYESFPVRKYMYVCVYI